MSSFLKDTQFYMEAFKAFKTEQLEQEIPYLRDNIIPAFLKTLANSKDAINILSVGAGEGEPDLYLIHELLDKFINDGKITYTVIEMNPDFVASFQQRVKQNSQVLRNLEFHWICDTFENVAGNSEFASKFDIIMLYHVLYYMDTESVLKKCVEDLLKPGGCVLCVVQGEKDFITALIHRYRPRFPGLWKNIQYDTIQDVERYAKKHGWSYDCFHAVGSLNIQPVFDMQKREGSLLLDFFFQTQDVVKLFGNEVLKEVLETLRGFRLTSGTFSDAEFRVAKNRGMVLLYGR